MSKKHKQELKWAAGAGKIVQGPALNNKYRLIDGKWVYAPKTKEERQPEKKRLG